MALFKIGEFVFRGSLNERTIATNRLVALSCFQGFAFHGIQSAFMRYQIFGEIELSDVLSFEYF